MREGVTPTGNQQHLQRQLVSVRAHRIIRGIDYQYHLRDGRGGEGEGCMMRENLPPKGCKGETEHGRESCCRNRKHRRR